MLIEIDFNSDEAIYIQLRNQINMHTVNKAYSILRQEGFIQLDRRRGAVVAIDADKAQAMLKLREKLAILLAKGCCKNIGREDVHALVDEIFDEYRR